MAIMFLILWEEELYFQKKRKHNTSASMTIRAVPSENERWRKRDNHKLEHKTRKICYLRAWTCESACGSLCVANKIKP